MTDEMSDGPMDVAVRVFINLAAVGLFAALVALVVATVIHET